MPNFNHILPLRESDVAVPSCQYDSDNEFVMYTLQKPNGERLLLLQYASEGIERFKVCELESASGMFSERGYKPCLTEYSRSGIDTFIRENIGVNGGFVKNTIPNTYWISTRTCLEGAHFLRSKGINKAFNLLVTMIVRSCMEQADSEPNPASTFVFGLTVEQLNPVAYLATALELAVEKKREALDVVNETVSSCTIS